MNNPVASRTAMQSALDQWTALAKLTDLASRVLTPTEVERVAAPVRKGAEECLQLLEQERVDDFSDSEEITEVVNLKQRLTNLAKKKS